jgi:hypothetical protein
VSTESVAACPECDAAGSDVYERETKTPAWTCYACGAAFEEPNWRAPRTGYEGHVTGEAYDHDGPTAADLDTPDTLFTDIMVGEKFAVTDTADGGEYVDPFAVIEVTDRTVWEVPFGDNWCDATVVLSNGGVTNPTHEGRVAADGSVELFATTGTRGPNHVADVTGVEHAGEVSTHSKIRLHADDGVEKPEGDDSWRRYYREGET